MISKILKKDHAALAGLSDAMKPEQRLVAFLNHSRFIRRVYQAGQMFRKKSSAVRSHKRSSPQR